LDVYVLNGNVVNILSTEYKSVIVLSSLTSSFYCT